VTPCTQGPPKTNFHFTGFPTNQLISVPIVTNRAPGKEAVRRCLEDALTMENGKDWRSALACQVRKSLVTVEKVARKKRKKRVLAI
jgi:hypothetical protein